MQFTATANYLRLPSPSLTEDGFHSVIIHRYRFCQCLEGLTEFGETMCWEGLSRETAPGSRSYGAIRSEAKNSSQVPSLSALGPIHQNALSSPNSKQKTEMTSFTFFFNRRTATVIKVRSATVTEDTFNPVSPTIHTTGKNAS